MSLLITAAAPPQIRRGASASPSDSSGDEFAGVLAGASSTAGNPVDSAVTPHALAKPHPAAKMQKLHTEDDHAGSDDDQPVGANPVPVALPPQRHQDIAGHRAKAEETTSCPVDTASDRTASDAGTIPATDPSTAMTATASMPADAGSAAGVAQPGSIPASAGAPVLTAAAAAAGPAAVQAAATGTPLAAGLTMEPAPIAPEAVGKPVTVKGGTGNARTGPASLPSSAFTKSMLASLQALGTEVPALGWLGGIHAPGSAPTPAVQGDTGTEVSSPGIAAAGVQGSHPAGGNPAPAPGAPVDSTPAAAPGQAGPVLVHSAHSPAHPAAAQTAPAVARAVEAFPASASPAGGAPTLTALADAALTGAPGPDASAANASAATTSAATATAATATAATASAANATAANAATASAANAATASAQAAGQIAAQPVTATGLQGAAGQPHAMTSTPTQIWTAAEPLGPQLTSSVLPLRAGGDGSHQLIIALHPEQLGPVNVHVRIVGDAMSIQLASGTQDAHETLRAALPELRHELQAAGLGTAQLSLDGGGTTGFSDSSAQRESYRNGRNPSPNPVAEPVVRTTRSSVPRTNGVNDSGLDRWL